MPRMRRFSKESVNVVALIAAVRSLAAEHGSLQYCKPEEQKWCLYRATPENKLGCIIGAALRKIGVSTTGLDKHPEVGGGSGIGNHLRLNKVESTFEQKGWLTLVQNKQDDGMTWDEAVRYADSFYTTFGD